MLFDRANCFDLNNFETEEESGVFEMGKDDMNNVEDVEEGEISDSASVEEITEEDFKQEPKVATKDLRARDSRVWTMQDLYKYPGYASRLYNFAWAQAVQNKPLNCSFPMDEGSTTSSSTASTVSPSVSSNNGPKEIEKVVIDDSGDEMDEKVVDIREKEEGELEEGEIDMDSEPLVAQVAGESMHQISVTDGMDVDDLEEKELDKRVNWIRITLESVTFTEAEKSFEGVCSSLGNALENLREVTLDNNNFSTWEALILLSFSAIQVVNSVFCSLDPNKKEQNEDKFIRLLSLIKGLKPSLFSIEQMKEIEAMFPRPPTALLSNAGDNTRQVDELNKMGAGTQADTLVHDLNKLSKTEESLAGKDANMSSGISKLVQPSYKIRAGLLPLLDLHKDHDLDSLPSPTREAPSVFPVCKLTTGNDSKMVQSESITSKGGNPSEDLTKRQYETDAFKAVSMYQQKFGRSSIFMSDRLPSPTPSEEAKIGDADTSDEVSSSSAFGNSKNASRSTLGETVLSSASRVESPSLQEVTAARSAVSVAPGPNAALKVSTKSRDPRLRFSMPKKDGLDLNRHPLPMVQSAPRVEHTGEIENLKKQKVEEDLSDGPALKRQRNGVENSFAGRAWNNTCGSIGLGEVNKLSSNIMSREVSVESSSSDPRKMDGVICSGAGRSVNSLSGGGGWLEDTVGTVPHSSNRERMLGNEKIDPRKLDNGVIGMSSFPTTTGVSGNPAVAAGGNQQALLTGFSNTSTLPSLSQGVPVNPTMLLNLLKMGQQPMLGEQSQQMPAASIANGITPSSSASLLGAVPSGHVPPPVTSNFGFPTSAVGGSPAGLVSRNEQMPFTGINNAASLPSLLKDIAVNPTILLNLLKMGQQSRLGEESQHISTGSSANGTTTSSSKSLLGAAPSTSMPLSNSAGLLQKPSGTLGVSIQSASTDDLGKIRMKPRDPRRVLHGNAPQVIVPQTSNNHGGKDSIHAHKQENLTDTKPLPSQSSASPDITPQFTKNLKSIADIMSTPQLTSSSAAVSKNVPPQPVKPDRVDIKVPVSSSPEEQQNGIRPVPEVRAAGTGLPHAWGDLEHLFEGYDEQQKAAIQRERARRIEEQKKMFSERKLCLVLDLDHTLLNSAKFSEVEPTHEEILRKKEEQDREKPQRHLFRFPHMAMWTKLRPGVWNFLERASKLYELHLYTMGNRRYATEMAKVLDPKGSLFAGRVISRGDEGDPLDGDEKVPKSKDLEGVLGMESAVVIIDDSVRVWPHNKLNLIVVERYTYFPCSRRQFGLLGPSLLEIDHDERPEDGTLASSLAVIERIHEKFFTNSCLDEVDVRNILATEQRKILAGCCIVFSRVFPVGEANPHLHPLWQTAEQFGAVCTTQISDQVTHVVANAPGTDKVNWAFSTGRFVVNPGWVEASALLYRRANEADFAIKP